MANETKNGVNPNQNLDPKQTVSPEDQPTEKDNKLEETETQTQGQNAQGQEGAQNQPEEEKKQDVVVKEFGFAEFKEAASRIIALPNVNNILKKCKGKIDDNLLKDIFDHNPIGENESLDAYATRCVGIATMFTYQNRFKSAVVDKRTKAEDAEKHNSKPSDVDYESSTIMMDKIANAIKNFHVADVDKGKDTGSKGALAATAEELLNIVKEQGILLSRDSDGNIRANELNSNEMASLSANLQAIANIFSKIYKVRIEEIAKVDKFGPAEKPAEEQDQTQIPVKDGEQTKEPEKQKIDKSKVPSVPKLNEKVSPDGKKITYAEFKAVADDIIKDPELAEAFAASGYTPDQITSITFDAGELLEGEGVTEYARRVLNTFAQKEIIERETGGTILKVEKSVDKSVTQLPTIEPEKRNKIGEGKEYESNPLFEDFKKLLKETAEQIRTVITGKDAEERKKEYELVNHEGVPIELDDVSRAKLMKKLNAFETTFNKVVETYRVEHTKQPKHAEPKETEEPAMPAEETNKPGKEEKVDRTKMSPDDQVYQQKVDKLVENLESLDLTNSNAVLTWMRDYSQTINAMESRPDVDTTKLQEAFEKAQIEMDPNAAEKYSNDVADLGQATKWAVTIGAAQILTGDKVREDVVDHMCEIETEYVLAEEKKAKEAEEATQTEDGKKPLPAQKVKWVKKLVDRTMEANYRNEAGNDVVENVRRDLDPEYDKKRQEEEKARQEAQNKDEQEDEHTFGPKK